MIQERSSSRPRYRLTRCGISTPPAGGSGCRCAIGATTVSIRPFRLATATMIAHGRLLLPCSSPASCSWRQRRGPAPAAEEASLRLAELLVHQPVEMIMLRIHLRIGDCLREMGRQFARVIGLARGSQKTLVLLEILRRNIKAGGLVMRADLDDLSLHDALVTPEISAEFGRGNFDHVYLRQRVIYVFYAFSQRPSLAFSGRKSMYIDNNQMVRATSRATPTRVRLGLSIRAPGTLCAFRPRSKALWHSWQ